MGRDYPTVLDLIGGTPIVRLQRIADDVEPTVVAKLEWMNPGGSVKDRIGLRMIEAAEREGLLRPGGTIVEPTSGNTGVGLAMVAALRGYRMIMVLPDKVAPEKISLLRAFGAEVVICPTAVDADSPESYYAVSDRLAEEIPGAYKPDQYSNQENPAAHYATTGPEIWEQTGGELDAVVISVGTGGSITGAARYLKEQNPELLIVGADPEGSIYSGTDVHPYLVEGIGKDTFGHVRPLRRGRVRARVGSQLVSRHAAPGTGGGDPRGRLRRHVRSRHARDGQEARARDHDPDHDSRRRPRLSVEDLRR